MSEEKSSINKKLCTGMLSSCYVATFNIDKNILIPKLILSSLDVGGKQVL
jgi:hypothetical protein